VIIVATVLCQPVEQGTPVLRGLPARLVGRAANIERELGLFLPFAVADYEAEERGLELELLVLVLVVQSVVIFNRILVIVLADEAACIAKVGARDARSKAFRERPARRGFERDKPVFDRQLVCRIERLDVVQEFVDARAIERKEAVDRPNRLP
jgi:hypothetical protein